MVNVEAHAARARTANITTRFTRKEIDVETEVFIRTYRGEIDLVLYFFFFFFFAFFLLSPLVSFLGDVDD